MGAEIAARRATPCARGPAAAVIIRRMTAKEPLDPRSSPIDAAEAVARARALAPQVAAMAAEAESLRRLPPALVEAIHASGLVRMLTPRRFGGHELPFDAFIAATLEIARADASVGWCFSFMNIHSWLLAGFPEQAQAEFWGADPDIRIANVNMAVGEVVPVEGGYRISGSWPWASGIDHCGLAILAGIVPPAQGSEPGPPDVRLFLIPRADFTVEDTWKVAGQRGTGSNNVVVRDAFVPAHRVVPLVELREAQAPGRHVNPGPNYQLPLLAGLAIAVVTPIVGAALGAYDRWREMTRDRVTSYSREQVASLTAQQIRMAEVSAELDCAQLLLRRDLDIVRNGPITLEQRVQLRRDYAYIATLCTRAVERLYLAAGAAANYEDNPLQRVWRDVHAIAAHTGLNFDSAGENFGRMQLGLPLNPRDPLF